MVKTTKEYIEFNEKESMFLISAWTTIVILLIIFVAMHLRFGINDYSTIDKATATANEVINYKWQRIDHNETINVNEGFYCMGDNYCYKQIKEHTGRFEVDDFKFTESQGGLLIYWK